MKLNDDIKSLSRPRSFRKASFTGGLGGDKKTPPPTVKSKMKTFMDADDALHKKKKVKKVERDAEAVKKTKDKEYNVQEYTKGLLSKYEAMLNQDPADVEAVFGKIIDWGKIDVDDIVDKLIITLEAMCGITLFPYQKMFAARIFQSVLLNDGEEITACWSRQSGKSETITDVIATLMVMLPIFSQYFPQLKQFKDGVYVGVFAPTEPQAKTIGERFRLRIRGEVASEFLRDPEVDIAVDDLFMSNGSYCRIHSAAPQAKVESKTYHIILIDECQEVLDEKILKSIHPMAAATSGTIVKTGTPHMRNCEFLEAIKRNKRLYQMSKGKVQNHFEYDYKMVCKYNERYKRFVNKEIARYGEDSDYFRMSYKLEWLLAKGMAITTEMFERGMRDTSLFLEKTPDNRYMYAAGLDLGKKYDSTVLTIGKLVHREKPPRFVFRDEDNIEPEVDTFLEADMFEKRVANWYEWEGDNWEAQVDDVVRVVEQYETMQTLVIDSTGVGDPIYEMISRRLANRGVSVVPFYYTLINQHKLAQLFYKNLNHGNIRIPGHAAIRKTRKYNKFMMQMIDVEKIWKNEKMIIRHGTNKGAKDDYVQSLFMMLFAAEDTLNLGGAQETRNYMSMDRDPKDDRYGDDGIIEGAEMGSIIGFENVRMAAREGRLVFKKASFSSR